MIKAVSSLHCLVFVGASSTELLGYPQDPAPSDTIDDMAKAVASLHCLVFVGVSPTDQSCRPQMPGSRRHDQAVSSLHCLVFVGASSKAVGPLYVPGLTTWSRLCHHCTALSLSAPALQSSRACVRCLDQDDMIKTVSSLHCLVFVGAASTELSGHRKVPGLTT